MPGDEGTYGSLAGLGAGGALAGLGLLGPGGWGAAAIGAGLGSSAGGLLGGLFGKKKGPSIDISAELAKISAIFESARAAARMGINQNAADTRRAEASNLAARGVYSSPVSENTFQAIDRSKAMALAQSDASIGAAQAGVESKFFGDLLDFKSKSDILNAERQAALFGQVGSLGGGLLWAGLSKAPAEGFSDSEFNTWQNSYKGGRYQSPYFRNIPVGNGVPYANSNLLFPATSSARVNSNYLFR